MKIKSTNITFYPLITNTVYTANDAFVGCDRFWPMLVGLTRLDVWPGSRQTGWEICWKNAIFRLRPPPLNCVICSMVSLYHCTQYFINSPDARSFRDFDFSAKFNHDRDILYRILHRLYCILYKRENEENLFFPIKPMQSYCMRLIILCSIDIHL